MVYRDGDEWAVLTVGRIVVMGIVVCEAGLERLGCYILGGKLSVISSGDAMTLGHRAVVGSVGREQDVRASASCAAMCPHPALPPLSSSPSLNES